MKDQNKINLDDKKDDEHSIKTEIIDAEEPNINTIGHSAKIPSSDENPQGKPNNDDIEVIVLKDNEKTNKKNENIRKSKRENAGKRAKDDELYIIDDKLLEEIDESYDDAMERKRAARKKADPNKPKLPTMTREERKAKAFENYLLENPPLAIDSIIDLSKLSDVNYVLRNTDMILAIMEICYNSMKYSLNLPNNTREFWKKVFEKEEWANFLCKYQQETLRKYWRSINDIRNPTKVIEIINNYSEDFNAPNVRLLPIIKAISSYISDGGICFDSYLKYLVSNQSLSVFTKEKMKTYNAKTTMVSKKRQREDIEADLKQMFDEEENDDNGSNNNSNSKQNSASKTYDYELTEEEVKECKFVEEMVKSLLTVFPSKSYMEIADALFKTSFDLENAYLTLSDENLFKGLTFECQDDRVIKFLNNTAAYYRLVNLKGEELIEKRKKFLKLL